MTTTDELLRRGVTTIDDRPRVTAMVVAGVAAAVIELPLNPGQRPGMPGGYREMPRAAGTQAPDA